MPFNGGIIMGDIKDKLNDVENKMHELKGRVKQKTHDMKKNM
jgi:hypothetical protein